MEVVLFLKH